MYNVQFVGLVCFFNAPGGGSEALFPDGRNPGPLIDKHFPRIIVKPEDVIGGEGWDREVTSFGGRFSLSKSSIELEGATEASVPLDKTQHDGKLPRLGTIAPGFQVDPAGAVVNVPIKTGTLKALRLPGTHEDNPTVALVSQLTVEHEGPITIRIKARNGKQPSSSKRKTLSSVSSSNGTSERTIRLKPGAEIVIANVSDRTTFDPDAPSHFKIYGKLARNGRGGLAPEFPDMPTDFSSLGVPLLDSTNPFFVTPQSISLTPDCGNVGCCP